MFPQRNLPNYFAILRPTTIGLPCFQIMETKSNNRLTHCENAEWVNKEASLVLHSTLMNENIPLEIYEVNIQNAVCPLKYWIHNRYFEFNNQKIPLLDFDSKEFLPMRYYGIVPVNTSANDNTRLYNSYKSIFAIQQKNIRLKNNSAKKESESILPKYIIDLVIQDHLQKKEACPITLNEFTNPSEMSVTNCYHCFDKDALHKWKITHNNCPVCRALL